jgi:hypothetical protein
MELRGLLIDDQLQSGWLSGAAHDLVLAALAASMSRYLWRRLILVVSSW